MVYLHHRNKTTMSVQHMVNENILLEKDYRTMFKNCVPIIFYEDKQDAGNVAEDIEFDGFDWDSDMKDAYSI